jgi:FkbM family methyltransferase
MFFLRWLIKLFKPLANYFPQAATLYRGVRDQLDSMEEPQRTPWGFKLAGNPTMILGQFEPTETDLVRSLLDDVDVLVNVGANVGYYCCHALSMGKPVIAFEPMERNLRYLYKNVKANNWDGVEIFPLALSNHIGVLEIYGGNTGASLVKGWAGTAESYKTLVPCSTMDVVLNSRLNGIRTLILVDIEGAEKWMLEGATTMLDNNIRPIWIVEIASKELQPQGLKMNPNFKSTFQMFFERGYQAFDLEQKMRPLVLEDIEKVYSGEIEFNSNNFLFCDPNDKNLFSH